MSSIMRGTGGFWVLCPVFLIASDFIVSKKLAANPKSLNTTNKYAQYARKKLSNRPKE